ncbi:hypothetical protein RRG08_055758 [Elysia crispata]|uniref:Uncharacterized protein n=1 Tax=Elysia crispata TaxID=231223 RepID=A0AAE1DV89_9GAST|nr:hypothetical protein RRG08_055758 [Elysia crispata]
MNLKRRFFLLVPKDHGIWNTLRIVGADFTALVLTLDHRNTKFKNILTTKCPLSLPLKKIRFRTMCVSSYDLRNWAKLVIPEPWSSGGGGR